MEKLSTFLNKNFVFILMISLTLGLAPFAPEPHIWGKLKWVAGGGKGMQIMDWFDTFLHGTPWILLILASILKVKTLFTKSSL